MDEIDIGTSSRAIYTHLEHDVLGRPVAAFVADDGEAFCLDRASVDARIRYLESSSREAIEERRALAALRAAGG